MQCFIIITVVLNSRDRYKNVRLLENIHYEHTFSEKTLPSLYWYNADNAKAVFKPP